MTTGLSYDGSVSGTTSYITQISDMAVVEPTNTVFLEILPQMITYAENRIYRDIDLLSTQVPRTYQCTAGNNILSVPTGDFITVQTVSINTSGTTFKPLIPTTKEFIRNVFDNFDPLTGQGVPKYFAMYGGDLATYGVTSDNIELGPTPDLPYPVRVTGTVRPPSMSATNLTTFVSLYMPDLMVMASMIYISAYQRNFGRANDDPQMAITYESQYNALLKGAVVEEARKKFQAGGWTAYSPAQVATPTRC
jgi:hypothetical protein